MATYNDYLPSHDREGIRERGLRRALVAAWRAGLALDGPSLEGFLTASRQRREQEAIADLLDTNVIVGPWPRGREGPPGSSGSSPIDACDGRRRLCSAIPSIPGSRRGAGKR